MILEQRLEVLELLQEEFERDDFDFDVAKIPLVPRQHAAARSIVTVRRGDYDAVSTTLDAATDGIMILTGGTGSGKSTFGVLMLMSDPDRRVLLAQPYATNVGNTVNDFEHVLPAVILKNKMNVPDVPSVMVVDLMASFDVFPTGRLDVCTTKELVDYMRKMDTIPPYTTIVVDEFHLATSENSMAKGLLLGMDHGAEVVLTSATPPGVIPMLTPNPDADHRRLDDFEPGNPPQDLAGTIWDVDQYTHLNGAIVYFLSTEAAAEVYFNNLRSTSKVPLFLINSASTVKDFQAMATFDKGPCGIILTPKVEAGVTIPYIKVLVNCGLTYTVVLKDGIVFEEERALTVAEEVQRLGRAGRNNKCITFSPQMARYSEEGETSAFYNAETAVLLRSKGVPANTIPDVPAFARTLIDNLDEASAIAAVQQTIESPYVAAHKYKNGNLYSIFGGTEPDFETDHIDKLRMYRYKQDTQFFISVICDLSSPTSDPSTFIPNRNDALKLSAAILVHKGKTFTFDECIDLFAAKPTAYVKDVLDAIESSNDLTVTVFAINVVPPAGTNYEIMFKTPELLKLFHAVNRVAPIKMVSVGSDYSFECHWRGKKYELALNKTADATGRFDLKVTNGHYATLMSTIMSAAAVGTLDNVTNLDSYKGRVPSSNTWFKNNVL